MNDDLFPALMAGILMCILVAILMGAAVLWEGQACRKRWEDSGMQARYSITTDCMIKTKAGQWIPEKNYRETP